ncbi:MAG: transcription antitermination factor NusB [Maricaulaceae bacterium]|jgi:N utilization substance protein B
MTPADSPDDYIRRRNAARLAAVQALYQMELSGRGAADVIEEFVEGQLHEDEETADDLDADLLRRVVQGVVGDQARLDRGLAGVLAEGWRLDRLDATVRAILRAGAVELLDMGDIPPAASIDAYVEIAHAFFDGPEPGFINAALDALARSGEKSAGAS